jgi:hypothetical protein
VFRRLAAKGIVAAILPEKLGQGFIEFYLCLPELDQELSHTIPSVGWYLRYLGGTRLLRRHAFAVPSDNIAPLE